LVRFLNLEGGKPYRNLKFQSSLNEVTPAGTHAESERSEGVEADCVRHRSHKGDLCEVQDAELG
jgi:hypothetical protein